ncbi:MAG: A24 family peptidase [Methylococcaceae bacterium]|nr:A24 family peptidase [Methylococcaceae bacterium]
MTVESVPTAVLSSILILAAVIDMRQHRLPNILTASAAVLGIILRCWLQGWSGLWDGLAGFSTGLMLFLPFYAGRWMGAGDVKLMAAVGTFLGWPDSLLAVGLSTGAGSIAAFGLLAVRGGLIDYLRRYWLMAKCLFFTGGFAYIPPKAGETSTQLFPFGLAIALGTFAALGWVGRLDPFLEILGRLNHE